MPEHPNRAKRDKRIKRGKRARRPHRPHGERRGEGTPLDRARKAAQTSATLRVVFLGHLMVYSLTILLILVTAGFMGAFITALAWGIGLAAHGFVTIVAPELRRTLVEDELDRRVRAGVLDERRSIRDEEARRVERLSASLAHEIRTPITAAKSLVQQMGEDPSASENVEYAEVALAELDRVEASIQHLLAYAREEPLELEPIELAQVIDSALGSLAPRLEATSVRVEREITESGPLRGDEDKTRRVVINLVNNALDALEQSDVDDKRVRIEAGHNLAGTEAFLRVVDNGPGMSAERQSRIFDPFYTSKESGTGLGLAISRKLIETQGGRLEVSSEVGQGSEFVVTFPRERAEVPQ